MLLSELEPNNLLQYVQDTIIIGEPEGTAVNTKERLELFRCASAIPDNTYAIDIGTRFGASAIVMALALKQKGIKSKVITIDINSDSVRIDMFKRNVKATGTENYMYHLVANSTVPCFKNLKISLLHIDGCHLSELVENDWNIYSKHLNGVVAFHDYENFHQVRDIVDKLHLFLFHTVENTAFGLKV